LPGNLFLLAAAMAASRHDMRGLRGGAWACLPKGAVPRASQVQGDANSQVRTRRAWTSQEPAASPTASVRQPLRQLLFEIAQRSGYGLWHGPAQRHDVQELVQTPATRGGSRGGRTGQRI